MHQASWDSEDYLAVYEISGSEEKPQIFAKDLSDNEEFVIKNISFKNDKLEFETLMPSTQRKGLNSFKINHDGTITSEFTFTVVETLIKGKA